MSTYRFKDASGKSYRIDAPEGMSEANAYEAFHKTLQAKQDAAPAYDPTAEMNWGEKALVNFGAGIDTTWQGAKQLVGKGMSDAELQQKREIDKNLAEKTGGGGLLQLAGEIAPSLAIPGAGFVRGAKAATQIGANAGRLLMGGEAVPLATQVGRGLGTFAADSAIAGAAGGALQPVTEQESRTLNTIIGGAAGALMPGLIAAARKGASYLTEAGAKSRAAAEIIQRLGGPERAAEVLQQAQGHGFGPPGATREIPLTTAEITQNPVLGSMERRSAADPNQLPAWSEFRAQQNQTRADALMEATKSADNVVPAKEAREAATSPMRERALAAAGKDAWFHVPVVNEVAAIRASDSWASPPVKKLVKYVTDELEGGITPGRLYQVRKTLLDNLSGPTRIGDELSNAAKAERSTVLKLRDSIDTALDAASKGKWTPYLKKYASKSGEVNDAEASALLREAFTAPGAAQRAGVGDMVPSVTGTKLGKAVERFGADDFGPTFAADTRAQLDALRANIAKTEGLQGLLKQTGTSGGGSNTTMDAGDIIRKAGAAKIPYLGQLLGPIDNMTKAAVGDALRNPELFIAGVSKKLAQRKPLTPSEDGVLRLLRSVNVGAEPALESQ